ncbi:MAG: hypothetical protein WAS73_14335 [Defluviicoccus sp.]
MIGALLYSGVPPVVLGRKKLELARELSDKLLHTDALMNKADWMTAAAGIAGVAGIGLGFWWADAVAAAFIAFDILRDGIKATKIAFVELADGAPRQQESSDLDPAIQRAVTALKSEISNAEVRVRESGRFVRFTVGAPVPWETADRLVRTALGEQQWRLAEVPVIAGPGEIAGVEAGHAVRSANSGPLST